MISFLRLYALQVGAAVRMSFADRANFALQVAGMAINNLVFLTLWVLFFAGFKSVGGWGFSDMALLLGLIGAIPFTRRFRWEGLAFLLLIGGHFLGYSRYNYWSGGVAWGSRYMLPVVPFLVLLAGPVLAWLLREPMAGTVGDRPEQDREPSRRDRSEQEGTAGTLRIVMSVRGHDGKQGTQFDLDLTQLESPDHQGRGRIQRIDHLDADQLRQTIFLQIDLPIGSDQAIQIGGKILQQLSRLSAQGGKRQRSQWQLSHLKIDQTGKMDLYH